jgi:hypothetical protein
MAEFAFWFVQVPGWAMVAYLVVAQCIPAISYDTGVRMGTQEPAECITDVGVAFWKGVAGADLVFYTPLLALGLLGQVYGANWAPLALGAALGITVYWPVMCLWTVVAARGARGWNLPKERQYFVVLPVIALWGLAGLVLLWGTMPGS